MNRRTFAIRAPAGCTTPFEMKTGVRQEAVAGPFVFSIAVDDIVPRTIYPADVILAPSARPLLDLEYANDLEIFEFNTTKLQHVVNFVSKLAAAYGLQRSDERKQMSTPIAKSSCESTYPQFVSYHDIGHLGSPINGDGEALMHGVMEKLECMEGKLFRCPATFGQWCNKRRTLLRSGYAVPAHDSPSEAAMENHLRFFDHVIRRLLALLFKLF
ncbi:hypothetical protein RB195_019405 [Necator americanus]|uniref:Reverse transcriptase domain-containing protein n=1 Tax=Necator americanus TaxID=51031 RepID=A0ABR1CDZ4_NECAM